MLSVIGKRSVSRPRDGKINRVTGIKFLEAVDGQIWPSKRKQIKLGEEGKQIKRGEEEKQWVWREWRKNKNELGEIKEGMVE
jgi:hypothetical protein